jgi:hypothetical protein
METDAATRRSKDMKATTTSDQDYAEYYAVAGTHFWHIIRLGHDSDAIAPAICGYEASALGGWDELAEAIDADEALCPHCRALRDEGRS